MTIRKRFLAGFAAAAIAGSMMAAVPAGADQFNYNAVNGGDFTFNKYLVVDENATIPKVQFSYTIQPDSAVTTTHLTSSNVELYRGVNGAVMSATNGTADFTSASTTSTSTASVSNQTGGGTSTITILSGEYASGYKYATDSVVVDFTACSFTEPGVYRYKLTETTPTAPYSNLTDDARTLDVYVPDKRTGTYGELEVTGYVLYNTLVTGAPTNYQEAEAVAGIGFTSAEIDKTGTNENKKSSGFVNRYETVDLTVSKAVTGNQGSKDKYFKFTIKSNTTLETTDKFYLSGDFEAAPTATSATSYTTANMAVTANHAVLDNTTNTYYVTGATLNAGYVIYMQANQNVVINGLPKGVSYTVTEDAENYTPSTTVTGDTTNDNDLNNSDDDSSIASGNTVTVSDTNLTMDTIVAYTNNRTGTIPTGVILAVAGPAVVGLVVVGGIIVINAKRRREDAED